MSHTAHSTERMDCKEMKEKRKEEEEKEGKERTAVSVVDARGGWMVRMGERQEKKEERKRMTAEGLKDHEKSDVVQRLRKKREDTAGSPSLAGRWTKAQQQP